MSHHNHRTTSSHGNTKESSRKLHKDWRVWLGVILMLGAMAMYVLSLDDSVVPRLFGH
ncbi:MAG: hypothetical protein NTV58_15420 [Deltaproteobacteria bacterium]|nr:hypothetical protein [Deltaproteobacteria bacterium]